MSFFAELRRRNVIRVAGLYVVTAWLLVQIADTLLPIFGTPDWVLRTLVTMLALGFVPALVFSWVFELTPEGLKREEEVDRRFSTTQLTARKLDIATLMIALLAIVLLLIDWMRPVAKVGPESVVDADAGRTPASSNGGADATAEAGSAPEAASSDPGSIAVLPFVNMSADAENEYFSDGISEELLNVLVKVDGLSVASRTSSFAYKGREQSAASIGAELKVAHVLEGSVRKSGQRVRITAQLIDARSDRHLWSETYDRELDDIFAIQQEIAEAMKELREALNEYMRELAEQNEQQQDQFVDGQNKDQQFLSSRDLDQMMKQIEQMAKNGSREQAQQMLSELRDLLDRLQSSKQTAEQGRRSREMMEKMDELGKLVGKQQQLMDDTFGKLRQDDQRGERGERGNRQQQGRQGDEDSLGVGHVRPGGDRGPGLNSPRDQDFSGPAGPSYRARSNTRTP